MLLFLGVCCAYMFQHECKMFFSITTVLYRSFRQQFGSTCNVTTLVLDSKRAYLELHSLEELTLSSKLFLLDFVDLTTIGKLLESLRLQPLSSVQHFASRAALRALMQVHASAFELARLISFMSLNLSSLVFVSPTPMRTTVLIQVVADLDFNSTG